MDFNGTSMESVLNRLSAALEGMGDGFLEQPAIPYTINQLLETAIDNRASLLHINVGSPPMLRINEQLVPVGEHQLTRGDCQKLLYPLLTREQRADLYSGIEIDGCFPASGTGFRLNMYKERGNLSASIRRLRSDIPSLDSLGLSDSILEHALMERSGLILLTGSPRCGKINTLAAMLSQINATRNARVISLEAPIQFWHQNAMSTMIQREVPIDTKSFAYGVQQAVLQDPDVIALTELPDRETAEFVIRAAAGGHLVIAVIDASSSARALERLINTFSSGENGTKALNTLSSALRLVICQTLVPRSSSRNMMPVFEIMNNSEAVRKELQNGSIDNLSSIMHEENMRTLGRALGSLVSAGTIDKSIALEFVDSEEELECQVQEQNEEEEEKSPSIPDVTDNPLVSWL